MGMQINPSTNNMHPPSRLPPPKKTYKYFRLQFFILIQYHAQKGYFQTALDWHPVYFLFCKSP